MAVPPCWVSSHQPATDRGREHRDSLPGGTRSVPGPATPCPGWSWVGYWPWRGTLAAERRRGVAPPPCTCRCPPLSPPAGGSERRSGLTVASTGPILGPADWRPVHRDACGLDALPWQTYPRDLIHSEPSTAIERRTRTPMSASSRAVRRGYPPCYLYERVRPSGDPCFDSPPTWLLTARVSPARSGPLRGTYYLRRARHPHGGHKTGRR